MPKKTDALFKIFNLLQAGTGVDFSYYKQNTLKRRIQQRMILYKLDKMEDYVNYLQNNPPEIIALYQDVLINVTSFFRDSEAFEALTTKVFPNVITRQRKANDPVRIWVVGCSTGEEAYSIAICLVEFLTNQGINIPIQIFATDINEVAIGKARTGVFKLHQLADISPERLKRFFVHVDGGYQISKSVRELCVFARQNLISDPPFSRLDLITCRNVLIYLGSTAQQKLLPIFHWGLKPTGFLMLGTSETVGEFADLFNLVDKKYKIYGRKIASTRLAIETIISDYPVETTKSPLLISNDSWNDVEIHKEADRIVLNKFAPVGVIINNNLEILQFRGHTSPYLQPAPGRPSFNLLKMAKEELRLELRISVYQAKRQSIAIKKEGIRIKEENKSRMLNIHVIPLPVIGAAEDFFLVLFEDIPPSKTLPMEADSNIPEQETKNSYEQEITILQHELTSTKDYLQSIIEEKQASNQHLRAANEEILSSNEELQITNEELETAREEIQATNEELNTINHELQQRNVEVTLVSNDLQNLFSSINISILILGSDLKIRRFNLAAEIIFNLIPTDEGRALSNIKHKLKIPDLEEKIVEVISSSNLKTHEVQDLDGYWYDLRIRPYRTIDNKIDGAVVILVDIDDIKRNANILKSFRDYAAAIVSTVRESLVVMDVDLKVVTANQFFYEAFHLGAEETENRLIYEIGDGQWNISELRSLLEESIPQQGHFQDVEIEHDFEQIGHKIMCLNGRKITQIGDTPLIILVIEDITQRKQLEAERTQLLAQEQSARTAAETANCAKDEFLSVLSHELRNPLSCLLGWTQLLRKQQLDEAKTNQALEAIERSAKAQHQLIGDLLDISRIGVGQMRLEAQPVKLIPVIEAAIDVVQFAADAKNIQIQSRLDSAEITLVGDQIRLQQVIWNLLSNSIKFTSVGGRIDITLDYSSFQAEIQVRDTGVGISADFLPYIFDRFRQADCSLTRSNTGLGLGLSIVRHLVELHGGTVEVTSPGEGQGATFTVRLPLQTNLEKTLETSAIANPQNPVISPASPASHSPVSSPSLAGVRVLMVDDEPDIRQLFQIVLEEYGIQVTEAGSLKEALSILKANPHGYDVLLSDIGLPEEDGYALIRQVRSLSAEEGGQIPAAAMTAYAGDTDQTEALSAGFQTHVAKPIEPNRLISVVAALAGRI